ncbi:MAG TPA: molybdopterin-dependent oxidoreductase [Candidatus Dormibacteraeota bacterium]|nr:molybdopterin-dependent oxidoreductase [Candidatus Dormibacteraeota bacterium]
MAALRWLLAGIFGSMAMLIWSFEVPPPLAQVLSDRMLSVTPGAVFGFLIDRLQLIGKPLFFLGTVALELAIGAIAALLLMPLARLRTLPLIGAGVVLGAVLALLARLLLGPEAGTPAVAFGFVLYGLVSAAAAALLGEAMPRASAQRRAETADGRRRFLAMAAAAIGGVLAAGTAVEVTRTIRGIGERAGLATTTNGVALTDVGEVADTAFPVALLSAPRVERVAVGGRPQPTVIHPGPPPGMPSAITSNREFYVISKNFVDPIVDARRWSLEVKGALVERPITLNYQALREQPTQSEYVTLECISNDIGGRLMSTARWTGVPLRDLLKRAGLRDAARAVAFTCADGYVESLPIEHAMDPTTLVVFLMNGEPLPDKHGFPARIVTTGLYGMKNPKWLTSIEPVVQAPAGFWERQGWSTTAVVKTMSRIDVPKAGATVTSPLTFGGVAFAGRRGIKRVEVSVDGGKTWLPAELERPLSPYAWTLWYRTWDGGPRGRATALVRATDSSGAVQTMAAAPSFPAGATGYDSLTFAIG